MNSVVHAATADEHASLLVVGKKSSSILLREALLFVEHVEDDCVFAVLAGEDVDFFVLCFRSGVLAESCMALYGTLSAVRHERVESTDKSNRNISLCPPDCDRNDGSVANE